MALLLRAVMDQIFVENRNFCTSPAQAATTQVHDVHMVGRHPHVAILMLILIVFE